MSAALSSVGIPMILVNGAVSAAPYAPAVVVLATGGVGGLATSASFIALSQITDYISTTIHAHNNKASAPQCHCSNTILFFDILYISLLLP